MRFDIGLKYPLVHSSLFDEFVCECQKRPNLLTNELNTTFFVRRAP
jgi:hypothetical protein